MKLYGACVGTRNIGPMIKFYTDVFGYGPVIDGPDCRFLDAQLILFDLAYMGDADARSSYIALVYRVDDVDAEFARLSELNLASGPPTDKPWGVRSFTVDDPDGNVVSFFTPLR